MKKASSARCSECPYNALCECNAIILLQRQIHYLYHNAPAELRRNFDFDFPRHKVVTDINERGLNND